MEEEKFSLYIHYPFCLSKCPYCDFNSYKLDNYATSGNFLNAYLLELENYYKLLKNREIKTIFFGGGTPSIMSVDFMDKILTKINNLWGIGANIEISMEANPTTAEINKFKEFHKLGINRLSIGVQSLNDRDLKFFGRIHDTKQSLSAIDIAQKIFHDRYSIDLIYARPQQKLSEWLTELKQAIELSPYHISLYHLIVEEDTVFYKKNIKEMKETRASIYYDLTNKFLENNNIYLYEVSNYAKKGYECQHNLTYWNNGEWLGIGAGAHSRICFDNEFYGDYKTRFTIENEKLPNKWIENVLTTGFGSIIKEKINRDEFIEEILLMGLRLKNGIQIKNIQKYLKINNFYDICDSYNLNLLQNENIISADENNLKVNLKYFNILNLIIEKLVK